MKLFKRITALAMTAVMALSMCVGASAADEASATIDTSRFTSLTLYKYDMTSAEADGGWSTSSYVSTGLQDDSVNVALAKYAIQGVEFSYMKVADLAMQKETGTDGTHRVVPLYKISDEDFLAVLSLSDENAYKTEDSAAYFESDALIDALSAALESNATTTKTALEAYMTGNGGTTMPETGENGKTSAENLEQGLYLVVETRVPENVTNTTAPFLVSLPMTTIDGDAWNYDVVCYPKNETGSPDLEKTVREVQADTGKNNGSADDIADGYAHTATASDGDTVDYQIISTLPTISSSATALTTYTFVDELSKGIQYNKNDVKIEWFTDKSCTDLIATWTESDGKFNVSYTDYSSESGSSMTIAMTEAALAEINSAESVYDSSTSPLRGYSNCTARITYSCTVNSDATTVYGDSGNPNEVELTWKRTNTDYYDTLKDCCHVYTYGLDLTKEFSDNNGDFSNVLFLMKNSTDNYYVQAELKDDVYYVTGHTTQEAEATRFSPVSTGKLLVKGLEDDSYIITEVATDDGYTLLDENFSVTISQSESATFCETCGKALLTASAKVNDKAVAMLEDNGSVSALVPLTVANTRSFDLPKTGGQGSMLLYGLGIFAVLTAGVITVLYIRKRRNA